jgi:muramidase (phage lysozyme)
MFDDLIPQAPQESVNPTQRAFLNAMRGGESGGRYNVMYGGKTFDSYADHPRQPQPIMSGPNAGRMSTAAGADQFLAGTWDEAKNALGLPDFSPDSQDRAAAWLAERDYKKRTGRDIWKDIEEAKGDPQRLNAVGGALSGTWTSLPGGIEPNRATGGFGQRMAQEFSSVQAKQQPAAPSLSFDDLIPQQSPAQVVAARFAPFEPPQNTAPLQEGLNQQARQMQDATRGPAVDPGVQASIDFQNQGIAAGQRTTPNVRAQMKNMVSDQVFESDSGTAVYRDGAGQLVEADKNKHVVLRDPADNRLKVFARSENTDEGALSAAGRLMGTGLAATAPTRRPAIPTPTAKQVEVRASDIFATSKPHYREFEKQASQIGVPTETATGIADRLRSALDKKDIIPDMAPQVYKAVELLDSAQAKLNAGEKITLDNLQRVKRVVGRAFNSPDKNVRDAASIVSGEIAKVIKEVSPEAAQSLKTADDIFSTAKAVRELQNKSSVADLRAGRAGYGGNAVNSMRQVLSPIVQKAVEGRMTNFKPDEIAAMREIVEGNWATNALRGVGQLSPSKGIIQTVGAGGALYAAGPAALAIPAIGAASNKLAAVMTGKQIEQLRELVAKRSPAYAQALQKSVERYEKAQEALVNKPGANTLGSFIAASRQLSAGLSRDGVAVSSGDLMRAIQGPMRSAAEDEQPEPEGVVNQ